MTRYDLQYSRLALVDALVRRPYVAMLLIAVLAMVMYLNATYTPADLPAEPRVHQITPGSWQEFNSAPTWHDRFGWLVHHSPDRAVSRDLLLQLNEHRTAILQEEAPTALFHTSGKMRDGKVIAVIHVTREIMANATSDADIARMQLTLSHEFVHVQQIHQRKPGWKLVVLKPANEPLTHDECVQHWGSELEAYTHECALRKQWGLPDDDIIDCTSDASIRTSYRAATATYQAYLYDECRAVYDELGK